MQSRNRVLSERLGLGTRTKVTSTMSKQKLELTLDRERKAPQAESRILQEVPEKSYHAKHRVTESDIFDNRLIFGITCWR